MITEFKTEVDTSPKQHPRHRIPRTPGRNILIKSADAVLQMGLVRRGVAFKNRRIFYILQKYLLSEIVGLMESPKAYSTKPSQRGNYHRFLEEDIIS